MSIRVYSLVAGGGSGTIPTLQQVCEQDNTTNTGIIFTAAGVNDVTIITGTGMSASSDQHSSAINSNGTAAFVDLDNAGIVQARQDISALETIIAFYPNTVGILDYFHQSTASITAFYKSTIGGNNDVLLLDSGNGLTLLPNIMMRKRQGGGQSIVTLNPIASSNIAESYLPYDTTNNGSTFQIRNTISGTITLTAGTATLTNSNIKSISLLQVSLKTPGGVMGVNYQITLSGTTFTVKSVDQTGATVATDTSTLDYLLQF